MKSSKAINPVRLILTALFWLAVAALLTWFLFLKYEARSLAGEALRLNQLEETCSALTKEKEELTSNLETMNAAEFSQGNEILKAWFSIDPDQIAKLDMDFPILDCAKIPNGFELRFYMPKGKHTLAVQPALIESFPKYGINGNLRRVWGADKYVELTSDQGETEVEHRFELPPESVGCLRITLENNDESGIAKMKLLDANGNVLQTKQFSIPKRELTSAFLDHASGTWFNLEWPDEPNWYRKCLLHLCQTDEKLNSLQVKFVYKNDSGINYVHANDIVRHLKFFQPQKNGTESANEFEFDDLFEPMDESGRYNLKPDAKAKLLEQHRR